MNDAVIGDEFVECYDGGSTVIDAAGRGVEPVADEVLGVLLWAARRRLRHSVPADFVLVVNAGKAIPPTPLETDQIVRPLAASLGVKPEDVPPEQIVREAVHVKLMNAAVSKDAIKGVQVIAGPIETREEPKEILYDSSLNDCENAVGLDEMTKGNDLAALLVAGLEAINGRFDDFKLQLGRVHTEFNARVDGVEERLGARLDGSERRMGAQLDDAERRMGGRLDDAERRIDSKLGIIGGGVTEILTILHAKKK